MKNADDNTNVTPKTPRALRTTDDAAARDEDEELCLWRRCVERLRRMGAVRSLRFRRRADGEGSLGEGPATGQCAVLVPVSHPHGRVRGECPDRQAAVGSGR